jgi:cytoskeletal protein RodZ
LRGISLDELELLTKIPRRSLERLEAGAFEEAPDGFARGFVRSVAAALGLDPDEAVMRLLREPPDEELAGAVRRTPTQRSLAVAVVLALATAALALVLWSLRAAVDEPAAEPETPEVLYRRDALRSLLEPEARDDGRGRAPAPAPPPDGQPAGPDRE